MGWKDFSRWRVIIALLILILGIIMRTIALESNPDMRTLILIDTVTSLLFIIPIIYLIIIIGNKKIKSLKK